MISGLCLVLDPKGKVEQTKKVIPCDTEEKLLMAWVEIIMKIRPDILIGYNSD